MQPRLLSPIPESPTPAFLVARLESAGYQVHPTPQGQIYPHLIELFGGFEGMNCLFDEAILRLCLNAQIRKGRAHTLEELKSIAQPQAATAQFYATFQELLHQGIFRRGYQVTCPRCAWVGWYETAQFTENMTCIGCHVNFQPPLKIPFSFKPNHLLAQGLKNGALTVLLFLHQLRSVSAAIAWGAGYQLRRDGQTLEVDIITLLGDVLTVVECKDDFEDETPVLAQLERGISLAHHLQADAYIFATLKAELPPSFHAFFAQPDEQVLRRLMNRRALLDSLTYWKAK